MNLSDGRVFCGRRYFDGSGGNNHALLHFQQTGHPLAVKLGTITPDGAGDDNTNTWTLETTQYRFIYQVLLTSPNIPAVTESLLRSLPLLLKRED